MTTGRDARLQFDDLDRLLGLALALSEVQTIDATIVRTIVRGQLGRMQSLYVRRSCGLFCTPALTFVDLIGRSSPRRCSRSSLDLEIGPIAARFDRLLVIAARAAICGASARCTPVSCCACRNGGSRSDARCCTTVRCCPRASCVDSNRSQGSALRK